MRALVYEVLQGPPEKTSIGRLVRSLILLLVALNVVAVILETVASIEARFGGAFHLFEVFSVVVFSIEYVLRLWCCVEDPRYAAPVRGRLRFALTPLLIVDLLAVVPFYLPMLVELDLRILRALRLVRLARILKLGRYSESLQILGHVFRDRKEELSVTVFILIVCMLVASSLMYFAEHEAQPEAFDSIPSAMWWAVATLTTVGYGDVYPVTVTGKLIGGVIAVLGIGMVALPAGILGSGFLQEYQRRRKRRRHCPHCGAEIAD